MYLQFNVYFLLQIRLKRLSSFVSYWNDKLYSWRDHDDYISRHRPIASDHAKTFWIQISDYIGWRLDKSLHNYKKIWRDDFKLFIFNLHCHLTARQIRYCNKKKQLKNFFYLCKDITKQSKKKNPIYNDIWYNYFCRLVHYHKIPIFTSLCSHISIDAMLAMSFIF